MNIAGLVKTSTIDYPDKLACVVFTAGCNYNCWYCHNRTLISNPPLLYESELFRFLKKRASMLEGVVISGGEPTLQKDLILFVTKIKKLGYSVKLDTNGSYPEVLRDLLKYSLIDYVAVDYKAPFEKYFELCGHTAAGVGECIKILQKSSVAWEMRTTLIPQLDADDLIAMAKDFPGLLRYALQRYRSINGEREYKYTPSKIIELADIVKEYQPNIVVRI